MAAYPPITAFDFEAHLENGELVQDLVEMPAYDFQHTAEFDFYRPTIHDYVPYPASRPDHVMLRADLAACLFETYNMKVKYVLAAAHDWNGEFTMDPLPTVLPDSKLKEIGMPAPPFPDCQLWAVNFFFKPEKISVIADWVEMWQRKSLSLSAWIYKARIKSKHVPDCSWVWPRSPYDTSTSDDTDLSDSDEEVTPFDSDEEETSLSDFNDKDSLASAVKGEIESIFEGAPESASVIAQVYSNSSQPQSLKRTRSTTPERAYLDDPNNWHVVLWQPTPLQRWEQEKALREGYVGSNSNRPVTPPPVMPPTPATTPVAVNVNTASASTPHINRPIRPLPIRATRAQHGPFACEYVYRGGWQEGYGFTLENL